MKKKKVMTKERDTSVVIYSSDRIRVSEELNGELFFEIENELTSDVSEAIAIVMNKGITDINFWKTPFNINVNNISPDKTLYWLSGGDNEWIGRTNYSKSWSEVYLNFQEEFGMIIINIIKYLVGNLLLNIPTIYEFSLEKGYIK